MLSCPVCSSPPLPGRGCRCPCGRLDADGGSVSFFSDPDAPSSSVSVSADGHGPCLHCPPRLALPLALSRACFSGGFYFLVPEDALAAYEILSRQALASSILES